MKDRTGAKERHWEDTFATFAGKVAWAAGHPIAFGLALLTLLIWVGCGPFFNYSQGWQLVVIQVVPDDEEDGHRLAQRAAQR